MNTKYKFFYYHREQLQSRNILLTSAYLLKSIVRRVYPITYEIILFHFSQLNLKDKLVAQQKNSKALGAVASTQAKSKPSS